MARDRPSPRLLLSFVASHAVYRATRVGQRLSRAGGLLLASGGVALLHLLGQVRLDLPSFLVLGGLGIGAAALGAVRVLLPTPEERIRGLLDRFEREDRRRQAALRSWRPTELDLLTTPTPFHVCTTCRAVASGGGVCDRCLCGTGIVPVYDESDRRVALVALGFVEPDDGGAPWGEIEALAPG